MPRRCKLWLVGSITAAALMLACGAASANSLSISGAFNARSFYIAWNLVQFGEDAGSVECPMSLQGTFHETTLGKSGGALIGHIVGHTLDGEACEGGDVTILSATLPWHVQYEFFSGTLPNISEIGVDVVGMAVGIRTGIFFSCLATTTSLSPMVLRLARNIESGTISAVILDPDEQIPLSGTFCPEHGTISGVGEATITGTERRIVVSLI